MPRRASLQAGASFLFITMALLFLLIPTMVQSETAGSNTLYLPLVALNPKVTTVNFVVQLPTIPDSEYLIDLVQWDIPNNGTDPVKTTDN